MSALEYDPYSYEIDEDPYPLYRRMQDEAPVYRNEKLDFWALTRFDHCLEALIDFKRFSSARSTVLELMDAPLPTTGLMIFMDPPRQTRYRNLVSKAFTPRRIAELEPRIREIACRHLDALVGRSSFDVVRDFTAKLPMDVISALLGIPAEDRDRVRDWSNALLHREPGNPFPTAAGFEAQMRLLEYFRASSADRRRNPRDDLMTALVEAELDGEKLIDEEIHGFMNLLATAGNETVTKLLASFFLALERFPDERRALVAEPERIPNAVEEILRYDPPSHYQGRTLTADVEIDGVVIPKDAKVLVINGASGRDPRRFPDPDRFDARREIDVHLGFGYGRHVCLGAFLARMESRIATEEFLRRFPEYDIPADGIERMHSSNVRGLQGLRVEMR